MYPAPPVTKTFGMCFQCRLFPVLVSHLEIRKLLAERIDPRRESVGMVAGILDARERGVIAHGALDGADVRSIRSMAKRFSRLVR